MERRMWGFYEAPQGHCITLMNSIVIAPLIDFEGKRVIGAGLKMLGLEFLVIFDPNKS